MRWSEWMSGDEFTALCARVKAEGKFIRHWMPWRGGYRVSGIYARPEGRGRRAEVRREPTMQRCEGGVAQLWFDCLKAF